MRCHLDLHFPSLDCLIYILPIRNSFLMSRIIRTWRFLILERIFKSKLQFTLRYQFWKLEPCLSFSISLYIFAGFIKGEFIVQVLRTPTHLVIVMEYAAAGELFERICNASRFSEDEVRIVYNQTLSWIFPSSQIPSQMDTWWVSWIWISRLVLSLLNFSVWASC